VVGCCEHGNEISGSIKDGSVTTGVSRTLLYEVGE
jgi:hypothetical protein